MRQHRTIPGAFVLILTTLILASGSAMAQLGPLLQINANPTNFDTTLCGTTKCRDIEFRNVGDAPLVIQSIGNLIAPFTSSFSFPLTLQPKQSRTFWACYSPLSAPAIDSQFVAITANGRVSLSIGMVFDTSGSMTTNDFMDLSTGTTITRIAAANRAGRQFVSKLVDTFGIHDEAGIFRYSSGIAPNFGFQTSQSFTTNRTLLENAVPNNAGGGTCTFQALRQTIDQIRTRNEPGRRVIVLLSDGDDAGCGGLTVPDVIGQALSPDAVKIYTIGIGNGITATGQQSLQDLANGTGGRFFKATTVQGLLAVYDSIGTMLSQAPQQYSFAVRGRAVAPFMVLNPTSIDYDSVRVGTSRCVPLTISNTGDAPLAITQITGIAAPFTLQNLPSAPILPNTQVTVDLCFTPLRLREQTGSVRFAHNSCRQSDQQVSLRGVGYDSVTVALVDTFDAKPGSVINVPVYLRDRIPAEYEVNEIRISVSYNKTMLFPLDQPIVKEKTLSAVMPLASQATIYDDSLANITYTLRNGTLVNPGTDSVLVRLSFLVLHGNSLVTPIRLDAVTFADGNPRVGRVQPGRLRADSLCYQQDRLIDASARFGGELQKIVSTGPAVRQISYTIQQPAQVTLALFDELGREVRSLVNEWRSDGAYDATLDASGLPNGAYYLRLEVAGYYDVKPILITK